MSTHATATPAPDPRRLLASAIRAGTILAAGALALGALWLWTLALRTPTPAPRDLPAPAPLPSADALRDLSQGPRTPEFWVTLGVVLLILTPAARVLAGVWWFARARERWFALAGLIVAIVLLTSLTLGLLH